MRSGTQCVVVGLFVDAGEHGEEDIPALLAPAGERAVYAARIGPDPLVTELLLDQRSCRPGGKHRRLIDRG